AGKLALLRLADLPTTVRSTDRLTGRNGDQRSGVTLQYSNIQIALPVPVQCYDVRRSAPTERSTMSATRSYTASYSPSDMITIGRAGSLTAWNRARFLSLVNR